MWEGGWRPDFFGGGCKALPAGNLIINQHHPPPSTSPWLLQGGETSCLLHSTFVLPFLHGDGCHTSPSALSSTFAVKTQNTCLLWLTHSSCRLSLFLTADLTQVVCAANILSGPCNNMPSLQFLTSFNQLSQWANCLRSCDLYKCN